MSATVSRPSKFSATSTQRFLKLLRRLLLHVEGNVDEEEGGQEKLDEDVNAVGGVAVFARREALRVVVHLRLLIARRSAKLC